MQEKDDAKKTFDEMSAAPVSSDDPRDIERMLRVRELLLTSFQRRGPHWEVQAPAWFIVVMTSILPVWAVRTWRRERRVRLLGLCARCGYDLRATPQKCPECGAVPDAAAAVAT